MWVNHTNITQSRMPKYPGRDGTDVNFKNKQLSSATFESRAARASRVGMDWKAAQGASWGWSRSRSVQRRGLRWPPHLSKPIPWCTYMSPYVNYTLMMIMTSSVIIKPLMASFGLFPT